MKTAKRQRSQERQVNEGGFVEIRRERQILPDDPRSVRKQLLKIRDAAEHALDELEAHEPQDSSVLDDLGMAFKAAADELLSAVEQTLAEMRAEREKTRELLDRLEQRLARHG